MYDIRLPRHHASQHTIPFTQETRTQDGRVSLSLGQVSCFGSHMGMSDCVGTSDCVGMSDCGCLTVWACLTVWSCLIVVSDCVDMSDCVVMSDCGVRLCGHV